jgi:hypothetical protein
MFDGCTRARSGLHEPTILGTPYSAMTYYQCRLCGFTWERGRGAFCGQKPPEPNYSTTTDQVRKIIREEIRSALQEGSDRG